MRSRTKAEARVISSVSITSPFFFFLAGRLRKTAGCCECYDGWSAASQSFPGTVIRCVEGQTYTALRHFFKNAGGPPHSSGSAMKGAERETAWLELPLTVSTRLLGPATSAPMILTLAWPCLPAEDRAAAVRSDACTRQGTGGWSGACPGRARELDRIV